MKKASLHLALLALAATAAAAPAGARDLGISAELGTTGVGVHLSTPIATSLDARVGVNAMNFNRSTSTSTVDYDLHLKMLTVDALLDYYPISNSGFRLSGGATYNGNKIDANGKPNAAGTYTLNGRTYTAAQIGTLSGKVDFREFAPYLGIGWGSSKEKGWSFNSDLGVLFQGRPRTSLTASNCTVSAAICQQLDADVAAENRSLNDKLHNFQYFPVVRVGARYQF